MKSLSLLLLLLPLLVLPLSAADSKPRIFLDKMNGFEPFLEAAIDEAELDVEVIEEVQQPDFKVRMGPKFKSLNAEIIYRKNTGRDENTVLEILDLKSGKVIGSHSWKMTADAANQKTAAKAFVSVLQDKLHLHKRAAAKK